MDTEMQNRRRINSNLHKIVSTLKTELRLSVSFITYISLLKLLRSSTSAYQKVIVLRHAKKLNWLNRSDVSVAVGLDSDRIVVNLSTYKLSDVELQLLSRALQFNIPPQKTDQTDTMTSFEALFKQISPGIKGNLTRLKHRLKGFCYQYVFNNRDKYSTLSREELLAYTGLQQNTDIIISKPDKGNGVVIMDRVDYINKLYNIVNDLSKFTELTVDPTEKRESRLQNFLYRLHKKGELDDASYKQLRPTGSCPSKLYGLPKIHKKDTPLRPIISQIGSYTYNVAKFLVPILKPLTVNEYSIKDSFSFAHELLAINKGNYMTSFDVVSLFTNIPLMETINICLDRLFVNQDKLCGISRDNLRKLILFASKENHFMFDNKFFDQIDGVSMGSPLGPILANIFMCHMESQALNKYLGTRPLTYRRYVDDCFLNFETTAQCNVFFDYMNRQHPNIRFTKEVEQDQFLPFLDIKIKRCEDGTLATTVFRKPTFSGLYLQWLSYVPKQYKISLIRCLLHRAWMICSSSALFDVEVSFIRDILRANGYPLNFLNSHIHKFKKIKFRITDVDPDVQFGPKT